MSETPVRLPDAGFLADPALARVLALLDRDGEEARVVGGAVRNALLGEPVTELDIATTALPDEVVRRAKAAGLGAIPTGIDHGTVTVVADGRPFEVTTLRRDVETFGRKAKVAFGRDWRADAERRDFTMNALSVGRDGVVHDPLGGFPDLIARKVRFIGAPARRIAEDHLRILRYFRFHASYGNGDFDRQSLAACVAARETLRELSRERVRMELMKLLVAPGAAATATVMSDTGILQLVLGGVGLPQNFAAMARHEAVLGRKPDPVRRLAALAVLVEEDSDRLRERLRLFNGEHRRLALMAHHWREVSPAAGEAVARALLYRLGPDAYGDRVLLAWSRADSSPRAAAALADPDVSGEMYGCGDAATEACEDAWQSLATLPDRWQAPAFPLKAAAFMARGIPAGPALGKALRTAEAAWIAEGFPLDTASLDRIVAEAAETG